MAIEYISGDFGSKCYPGNPERHYPSCQGIMCGFGVMNVICYPKGPEAVQSGVDAAPNGFTRFFAKMGATTGPIAAQKNYVATLETDLQSLTVINQEMLEDRGKQALMAGLGALYAGPLGTLAAKAADKKGEGIFAVEFRDDAREVEIRGKKIIFKADGNDFNTFINLSKSKRIKSLIDEFSSGTTAPDPSSSNVGDSTSELEKIIAMKEKGLLTDEEFSAAKAKVLGL
jgi:hypothetical protein